MSTYTEVERRSRFAPYYKLIAGVFAFFFFFAFLIFGLEASSDLTGRSALYLLMMVQLAPVLITLALGKFNYLIFVLINHFIVYSCAKFNLITNIQKLKNVNPETLLAFQEMTYCTILIILSYFFFKSFALPKQKLTRKFDFLEVNPRLYFWLGLFTALHPFIMLIMPGSLITLHTTAYAIALVIIFCSTCYNKVLERWVKLGIALSALQAFIIFGSLSLLGTIGPFFLIVTVIQRKIQNMFILFVMLILGTLFQSIKLEFRLLTRVNDDSMPIVQRMKILNELVQWKFLGGEINPLATEDDTEVPSEPRENENEDENAEMRDALAKGFTRVGDDSLERVLLMTPSRVPYWEGESYTNMIYFFVPRFLWPGKPSRDMWNKFGRRYGFLSEDDFITSVGINFLGEAYMNFGFAGLYLMAIIFGFLVACMESLSHTFLKKPNYFTFICFAAPFLNYGLDFGTIVNSIVLMLVILTLLRFRLMLMVNRDVYA